MSANHQQPDSAKKVNFGHQEVSPEEKTERVNAVFRTVAKRYDVMNDIISFGSHRIFKRMVLHMSGVRAGGKVLDLAGGTLKVLVTPFHNLATNLNNELATQRAT